MRRGDPGSVILAINVVCYAGERVVMVVADTESQAISAVNVIEVDYAARRVRIVDHQLTQISSFSYTL